MLSALCIPVMHLFWSTLSPSLPAQMINGQSLHQLGVSTAPAGLPPPALTFLYTGHL